MGTDYTTKEVYCRKCGKKHGVLKYDGQVFVVGNIEFYNSARYSCSCGVPTTFFAAPVGEDRKGFEGETRKILNSLGDKRKPTDSRQSKENKEMK